MLKVINLSKHFKEIIAVNNISFEAKEGEIFGLLGPNGAGKTTALRVMATVLKPTSGTANIAGFDIMEKAEEVRKNIGVLTADIGLYDRFTARENLRYFGQLYGMGGKVLEDRIEELIKVLHMERFANRKAGKFSTGMKQKVAIGRSIIHNPKVIIFDEPTAGLDILASQTVINFMKQAKEMGKLVILSTHDMNDAQKLCDRVAIIHRGSVVAQGTLQEIFDQTGQTSLENAFVKIIGTEAVLEEERINEEKMLNTKRNKKKLFYTKKNYNILRFGSIGILLIGFTLQYFELVSNNRNIGMVVVIIGLIGALISNIMKKKLNK